MKKHDLRKQRRLTPELDICNYFEFQGVLFNFDTQTVHGVQDGNLYPLIGKTMLLYQRAREKGAHKIAASKHWFD